MRNLTQSFYTREFDTLTMTFPSKKITVSAETVAVVVYDCPGSVADWFCGVSSLFSSVLRRASVVSAL